MRDPRNARLARTIVRHSTRLQPGEVVLIESFDLAEGLVNDLVDEALRVGAIPIVYLRRNAVIRQMLRHGDERHIALQAEIEVFQMKKVQAYVGLRATENISELSDVPPDHMTLYARYIGKPVHSDYRVNNTKWVVLRYPIPAMAQLAGMSTEQFEDFYYEVCTIDYGRMSAAIAPLAERMRAADRVRIKGPGTDLRFSIKGIGAAPCEGRHNLPDGECYTAPVLDSVEGTIAYNTPSLYLGTTYSNIRFTFENGRIVTAAGDPQEKLDRLLDTDEGARRIGEFSLAFNPLILQPMKDTLFDEKIAGSLHFTPGQAYALADNGNRSQIHWDIVLIQRPEHGGGEIWFDGELIRKDGRFVPDDLQGLNPERLTSGLEPSAEPVSSGSGR